MYSELTFHIWGRQTAMARTIGILVAPSGKNRHQALLDALEEAAHRVY